MGTPINSNDVSDLIDKYVHFAAPKFWQDPPCVNGRVKYIQVNNSKAPTVLYVKPYGEDYLTRVDLNCYSVAEQIEEHEQHKSHSTPDAEATEATPSLRHKDDGSRKSSI